MRLGGGQRPPARPRTVPEAKFPPNTNNLPREHQNTQKRQTALATVPKRRWQVLETFETTLWVRFHNPVAWTLRKKHPCMKPVCLATLAESLTHHHIQAVSQQESSSLGNTGCVGRRHEKPKYLPVLPSKKVCLCPANPNLHNHDSKFYFSEYIQRAQLPQPWNPKKKERKKKKLPVTITSFPQPEQPWDPEGVRVVVPGTARPRAGEPGDEQAGKAGRIRAELVGGGRGRGKDQGKGLARRGGRGGSLQPLVASWGQRKLEPAILTPLPPALPPISARTTRHAHPHPCATASPALGPWAHCSSEDTSTAPAGWHNGYARCALDDRCPGAEHALLV